MTNNPLGDVEGVAVHDTPRASGSKPTLRIFDPSGREVFWAEVNREMLVEFFKAAQEPGEHTIQLQILTQNQRAWLIDKSDFVHSYEE